MKWKLRIKHGWGATDFRFKKITDAEAFLNAFIEAKQPDTDDNDRKWGYSIQPILEDEKTEEVDDDE